MKAKKTTIHKSSGNIFRDLGFDAEEARDLKLRSDLMIALRMQISSRNDSQSRIAALLGVSQPRISDLMRGKIHLFSLDTLVAMLGRLGATVSVSVQGQRVAAATDSANLWVATGTQLLLGAVTDRGSAFSAVAVDCAGTWSPSYMQTAEALGIVGPPVSSAVLMTYQTHLSAPGHDAAAVNTQLALAA